MDSQIATTSFGRRPATLGQIAARIAVQRALDAAALPGSNAPAAVDKWRLFRTLTQIRDRLGVSDRSLSVLNALLSFHPEVALSLPRRKGEGGEVEPCAVSCELVVFPSNRALSARAHGMAGTTLWRHLTALVEAGLIARRDSPNGKRYARKDEAGHERFSDAFGFDLTPLVARAGEFEALAEAARAEERRRHLTRERVSLLRRDVGKLVGLGLDEGLPGDWEGYRLRAMALMTPLRRIRSDAVLDALATELASLRAEIADLLAKLLESQASAKIPESNDHLSGEHQSNSKTKTPTDLEPASEEEGGPARASAGEAAALQQEPGHRSGQRKREDEGLRDGPRIETPMGTGSGAAADPGEPAGVETKSYPLGMVMEACPDLRDYGPGGQVRNWRDFMAAAAAVRPMIGISPDAWAEAQATLGQVEAHVVVATILQRSVHSSEARPSPGSGEILVNGSPAIRSAGGYLRALTDKAKAGEFALGPVLMALIGQRLKARRTGPSGATG